MKALKGLIAAAVVAELFVRIVRATHTTPTSCANFTPEVVRSFVLLVRNTATMRAVVEFYIVCGVIVAHVHCLQ